jgi:hypothetical protein
LQAVFDREFPIKGGIDAFFTGRFAEFFTERLVEFFTERFADDEDVWLLIL